MSRVYSTPPVHLTAGSIDDLTPLPREFYARPVVTVARECIGKRLVHREKEGRVVGRIVEAEAYRGPEDLAAHSRSGRRTRRTEVMYGPAGYAYVFFVYGMHWNFNCVTGLVGQPHAVLIRAVEPLEGIEIMAARRGVSQQSPQLTNGPGKLCEAFGITREHYGADLCSGGIFLAEGPRVRTARSCRIGVDYAGAWALKTWRFYDPRSRYVSRRAMAGHAKAL